MAEQKTATEAKKRKLVKGRHRSAIKRQRQNLKRASQNRVVRSRLKEAVKKVRAAIQKKDKNLAREAFQLAAPLLQRAAAKGLLHARNASRHISRLASSIQSL